MSGVFLSYRRDDVGLIASDIAEALQARLDVPLFFDLESIQPGTDYKRKIAAAIGESDVAIVLLGSNWEGRDPDGRIRIQEPDDVFRHEIEMALAAEVHVVPVLVGIRELNLKDLGTLAALYDRQCHQIRLGNKKADIEQLTHVVSEALYDRRREKLAGRAGASIAFEPYKQFFQPVSAKMKQDLATMQEDAVDPVFAADTDFHFRINLALVTRLPLLLISADAFRRQAAAMYVARSLQWRYYEHLLSSRSKIRDLLYYFDDTRRIRDAQTSREALNDADYVSPGLLWWAFDPASARNRGMAGEGPRLPAADPGMPGSDLRSSQAVICIDALEHVAANELNDLFSILGSLRFSVEELGLMVTASNPPLTVLGAIGLRALSSAVLRSVIIYELPFPKFDQMSELACAQFGKGSEATIAEISETLQREIADRKLKRSPDATDFLNVVRGVVQLQIKPGGANWRVLLDALGLLA